MARVGSYSRDMTPAMLPGTNDGAGERAEVGADVEQTDHNGRDAGEQCEGGSWVALKEAAALLGVSIDTVKRRMQRGEVEARRETIPQGFRCFKIGRASCRERV